LFLFGRVFFGEAGTLFCKLGVVAFDLLRQVFAGYDSGQEPFLVSAFFRQGVLVFGEFFKVLFDVGRDELIQFLVSGGIDQFYD
jgi:hypothetical protein